MELAFELCVDFLGVDKDVAFEVVFETAEVEVCGAHGGEFVVDDEHFAVEHTGFEEVDFNAGLKTFLDVGEGGVAEHCGVAMTRNHDADVDSRLCGSLKGSEKGFSGEEVGSLDIDALFGV